MEYKETLNLPATGFPMKANLTQKEVEILGKWAEMELYEKLAEVGREKPKYILHDGPPYANGHIHIGHSLNKILKDVVLKSKRMSGFEAPYVPGWDCHGLPIELQVEKNLGSKKHQMSKAEMRKVCREYAAKFVDIQSKEFERLGILGEWEKPYLTMDYVYEGITARELAEFAANGGLFKGKKPVHWCSSCVTALAEAEVEYADHRSPSIYVKFPLKDDISGEVPSLAGKNTSLVIWTTTPWTLPANLAISLHPEFDYVGLDTGSEVLIVAAGLLDSFRKGTGVDGEVIATFKGEILEKKNCRHPFYDRDSVILLGEHVTLEAGTGCVHTAPGHGQDDYVVGLRYGLDIYNPVDNRGRFLENVEFFAGQAVFEANKSVIEKLTETGMLLGVSEIIHSYPHCWRCKKPIIFRATEQWFISMEANGLREKALEEINKVNWIPRWGRERIYGMVEGRPDWCISRQRSWGVPITAFLCQGCGEAIADPTAMRHVADLFTEHGSDIWYQREARELLPEGFNCPFCGSDKLEKEMDILDVWFDSGVSHAAVLETRANLSSPADLYLEGSDQHRGWFHSSLLVGVGTRNRAPYRSVLTHGFVLDGAGRKMSKSLGNVTAPDDVIKKFGADVLRLWVSAQDYRDDNRISQEILTRVSEAYRRIRNTCRYILGNISDFDPIADAVPFAEMLEIDRWALHQLEILKERVLKAYDEMEFHAIYQGINAFCSVEMSAFYLDILKDRLYSSRRDSLKRRSAQTVLYQILDSLVKLMAPVLSFTAEEVWWHMPKQTGESVHLTEFPTLTPEQRDDRLMERWNTIIRVRGEVSKALELSRVQKTIGHSLDASVTLSVPDELHTFLTGYAAELKGIFIVSKVELVTDIQGEYVAAEGMEGVKIQVTAAPGSKCERCWCYDEEIGASTEHPTICPKCLEAVG
jgi:isoleucyl-tRNA synthetase